jgi:glycosyltransferase involved in cell wall biosynthesis
MISIVIPCYNEEESLPYFYEAMSKIMKKMKDIKFELIFVNDGSKDKTLKILKDLSEKDKRVKYISFSRNFGKESAMLAGLEYTSGDYVAIMDADLQDPPELIEEMYDGIVKEGYDCVGLRRVTRKGEPPIRSFFARCYYGLINKISKVKIVDGARDFRLMTRQMVNSILELQENNRYSKGIFAWVGYNTKWLEYENVERVAGVTKWSFYKLFLYSIESIIAFSTFPLTLAIMISLLLFFITFVLVILMLVMDTTSLFKLYTFITFIAGLQLFFIGILGLYLSKIHVESQDRPKYIVKETNIKG